MIVWIERPLVLAIHDRQLAEHGGASGVRADALLDSALARPRQLLSYGDPPPDLAALAASLVYGLARNHPFVDGNKRTAAVACETFIVLNGASLVADDLEALRVLYRAGRRHVGRGGLRGMVAASPASAPPAARQRINASLRLKRAGRCAACGMLSRQRLATTLTAPIAIPCPGLLGIALQASLRCRRGHPALTAAWSWW